MAVEGWSASSDAGEVMEGMGFGRMNAIFHEFTGTPALAAAAPSKTA